jgi:hypothetical protein
MYITYAVHAEIVSVGQRYLEFISHPSAMNNTEQLEALFAPNVKKTVNSNLICTGRDQLAKQMKEVNDSFGISKVDPQQIIIGADSNINVIHFEISFASDNSTESVISIIRSNDQGLIEEINEVFNDKKSYTWQPS